MVSKLFLNDPNQKVPTYFCQPLKKQKLPKISGYLLVVEVTIYGREMTIFITFLVSGKAVLGGLLHKSVSDYNGLYKLPGINAKGHGPCSKARKELFPRSN